MSPDLFILYSEKLYRILWRTDRRGDLHSIKISHAGPSFHHLVFVDDLILCGRATQTKDLQFVLHCIQSKLASWKAHNLLRSGQATLANSVAQAILAYTMMSILMGESPINLHMVCDVRSGIIFKKKSYKHFIWHQNTPCKDDHHTTYIN